MPFREGFSFGALSSLGFLCGAVFCFKAERFVDCVGMVLNELCNLRALVLVLCLRLLGSEGGVQAEPNSFLRSTRNARTTAVS